MNDNNVKNAKTDICHIREPVKYEVIAAPIAPILKHNAAKPTVMISIKTSIKAIAVQMCQISIIYKLKIFKKKIYLSINKYSNFYL